MIMSKMTIEYNVIIVELKVHFELGKNFWIYASSPFLFTGL